jgi:hypothetical protein
MARPPGFEARNMAQITISIPDAVLPRVLDAMASAYGYSATLPDGSPNPQSKAQFARQQLANFVKQTVAEQEVRAAVAAASQSAASKAAADIAVT